jgi:hypothetical protein
MASITPKTDVLGYYKAAHLLRRATFKVTKQLINQYASKTPQQALDDLFVFTSPVPSRPLLVTGTNPGQTYYLTVVLIEQGLKILGGYTMLWVLPIFNIN